MHDQLLAAIGTTKVNCLIILIMPNSVGSKAVNIDRRQMEIASASPGPPMLVFRDAQPSMSNQMLRAQASA
jgi:hypothetical protein